MKSEAGSLRRSMKLINFQLDRLAKKQDKTQLIY